MILVVLLAAETVGLLVLYLAVRAYARTVESSAEALSEKVHHLARVAMVVRIVSLVLGPAGLVFALTTVHTVEWSHFALAVGIGLIAIVGPLVATSRALRPSLRRLRDSVPAARNPLLKLVLALTMVGTYAVVLLAPLLIPGYGPVHLVVLIAVVALGLTLVQTVVMPAFVVSLRSTPLGRADHGRLLSLADRLGVRVRDIRQYPARNQRAPNAMQAGILPWFRYILVADYLLDHFPPDEVDAVVGHELGHAREYHTALKLGAFAVLLGAFDSAVDSGSWANHSGVLVLLPALYGVMFFVTQGVLGLVLEERADEYGAKAVGRADLAKALDHLAELSHAKRETGVGWAMMTQHPGIAERIRRLRGEPATPEAVKGRRIRTAISVGCFALLAWAVVVSVTAWEPAAADVDAAQSIGLQPSDLVAPGYRGYQEVIPMVSATSHPGLSPCTPLIGRPWLADITSNAFGRDTLQYLDSTVMIFRSSRDPQAGQDAMADPEFGDQCLANVASQAVSPHINTSACNSPTVLPVSTRKVASGIDGAVEWREDAAVSCALTPSSQPNAWSQTVTTLSMNVGRIELEVTSVSYTGDNLQRADEAVLRAMIQRAHRYLDSRAGRSRT